MNKIVSDFLHYLKIPVSRSYCERLIASHPDFPSLLSIVDVLDAFQIKHIVARIEKDRLNEVSFPYLARLDTRHGDMIPIKNSRDLEIKKDDLQFWDGIVLKIEPTAFVADSKNKTLYEREKMNTWATRSLVAAFISFMLWSLAHATSVVWGAELILAILGVVVGFVLVAKELGFKNQLVEDFCSGEKASCDVVLNSEGAKLGWLKLSDITLSYFIALTAVISTSFFVPGNELKLIGPLAITSLLTIPVVVYSLTYQYFAAGKWCRLCLLVDIVLVIQVILIGILFTSSADISLYDGVAAASTFLSFFLIAGCVVIAVRNQVENSNEIVQSLVRAERIKNSSFVFEELLKHEKKTDMKADLEDDISIGSKNAPITIVMVSNLYCNPCKDAHVSVHELVDKFPNYVRVIFRFVESKEKSANQYLIQYWWQFLRNTPSEFEQIDRLMSDWYADMDLAKFKVRYPLDIIEHPKLRAILDRHEMWIQNVNLRKTPTFFVNGWPLPDNYEIHDLAAIVPAIIDAKESAALQRSVGV
ncbi:MAG TPA: thioredoxin domain-containing protein [Chryseolinea sp.]|nr:thioredoxin domain-containing protein [Chryseolinea sp.]